MSSIFYTKNYYDQIDSWRLTHLSHVSVLSLAKLESAIDIESDVLFVCCMVLKYCHIAIRFIILSLRSDVRIKEKPDSSWE
jgi:hypothetical protein